MEKNDVLLLGKVFGMVLASIGTVIALVRGKSLWFCVAPFVVLALIKFFIEPGAKTWQSIWTKIDENPEIVPGMDESSHKLAKIIYGGEITPIEVGLAMFSIGFGALVVIAALG